MATIDREVKHGQQPDVRACAGRRDRRRPGRVIGRLLPGAAWAVLRHSRGPIPASATRGASAGTRCACSPLQNTTGSSVCRSLLHPSAFRRRTRWPTISRPTRSISICRCRRGSGSIVYGARARGTSSRLATGASKPITSWSRWPPTRTPRVPEFARDLDPGIVQLHSRDYSNPGQLRTGDVLLVGAGNSGADIAFDVARSHRVVAGGAASRQRAVPHREPDRAPASFRCSSVSFFTGFSPSTRRWAGGRVEASSQRAAPLIRVKPADLVGRRRPAGATRRLAFVTASRSWPTAACSTSPTWSGARASTRGSRGSICRRPSTALMVSRCTSGASCPASPGSTSSASISFIRSRRR